MSRINIFTKAFRIFKRTTEGQRKETRKFIGEDHLGNKYFEANKPAHIRPVQRYFERPGVQSFDAIVDAAHVPPAWDAWLRFRRQEPPSKEEIEEGEEYYKMQQEMAARKRDQAQNQNPTPADAKDKLRRAYSSSSSEGGVRRGGGGGSGTGE